VRAGAFRLLRLVHRLKPELILSGMAHLNFLVLLLRPFFRVEPRSSAPEQYRLRFPGLWRSALLYPPALPPALPSRRRVICQTQSMADDLARELGVPENRLAVLPNPWMLTRFALPSPESVSANQPGPRLLAVGRLAAEKASICC